MFKINFSFISWTWLRRERNVQIYAGKYNCWCRRMGKAFPFFDHSWERYIDLLLIQVTSNENHNRKRLRISHVDGSHAFTDTHRQFSHILLNSLCVPVFFSFPLMWLTLSCKFSRTASAAAVCVRGYLYGNSSVGFRPQSSFDDPSASGEEDRLFLETKNTQKPNCPCRTDRHNENWLIFFGYLSREKNKPFYSPKINFSLLKLRRITLLHFFLDVFVSVSNNLHQKLTYSGRLLSSTCLTIPFLPKEKKWLRFIIW